MIDYAVKLTKGRRSKSYYQLDNSLIDLCLVDELKLLGMNYEYFKQGCEET